MSSHGVARALRLRLRKGSLVAIRELRLHPTAVAGRWRCTRVGGSRPGRAKARATDEGNDQEDLVSTAEVVSEENERAELATGPAEAPAASSSSAGEAVKKPSKRKELPLETGGGQGQAISMGSKLMDKSLKKAEIDEDDVKKRVWRLIGILGMSFVLCNLDKVNMSVAVIPLAEQFGWSATDKGLVSSSFFWGYALTQIPAGAVASKLGGGPVLVLAVLTWSMGTALAPMVAHIGIVPLSLTRLMVGLGEGFAPSAVTDMLASYVPKKLRARAVTAVFGGMELGNALGLLICGPLIVSSGWASVFYGFAALGFVWCLAWPFFSPRKIFDLSDDQLASARSSKKGKIPYGEFFQSKAVWAVITAHFCHNWGYYTLLAWLPSYIDSVFDLGVTGAARLSLIPYAAMALMIPVVGTVADNLQDRFGTTRTRKIAQGVAFAGPASCMLLCALLSPAGPSHPYLLIGVLSLAFALSTFSRGGLYCNHQDLSPKFAAALLGISNTAGAFPGIIGVWLTGKLCDVTGNNWALSLFVPIAAAQLIGLVVFSAFGSGEQEWE